MKQIDYRGGIVSFRIPDSWIEEYEPDGGGTFYDDSPDSGTLRLNVLTFEGPNEITSEDIARTFSGSASEEVVVFPNGNVVEKYVDPFIENDEELLVYNWKIGSPVPPNHARIAVFTYTILAEQATDARIMSELKMLDEELTIAKFASVLGELS